MSTKTKQYVHQSLASSGFAVMSSVVAYRLRPDLWASGQECSFFKRGMLVENVERMTVTVEGLGDVLVLTRSTDMLAKRFEWVTGFKVEKIATALEQSAPVEVVYSESRRQADKQKKLEALSSQELPDHDCHLRREIMAARTELGRMTA
jgi:hypothetical protein